MTRLPSLALSMLAALAGGCAYPDQFRNADIGAPHAALVESTVRVMLINRQPTAFWRFSGRFRVPVGPNTLEPFYTEGRENVGYAPLRFVAVAGSEYTLTRRRNPAATSSLTAQPHPTAASAWIVHDWRDCAVLERTDPGGRRTAIATSPREDPVFEVASSREALVRYRRENP